MKKLTFFCVLMALACSLFAAEAYNEEDPFEREKFEAQKTTTEVIVPENQHCTDKNASVKIEYQPIYDEIRIYYKTLMVTYDVGEAMNTVIACVEDFEKEHDYKHYSYLKPGREKSFKDERGQRWTQWSAQIKLTR